MVIYRRNRDLNLQNTERGIRVSVPISSRDDGGITTKATRLPRVDTVFGYTPERAHFVLISLIFNRVQN